MDSAESDPRPASDWTNALDAIAVDIVRSLAVPPAVAPPPPVADAPKAAPEAEPAPPAQPPTTNHQPPTTQAAPEPEAAVADVPADVPTPPAVREGDAEGLGEAIRDLALAGIQLDRLQACLQQAEEKAGLATGQLAIETELLQRFREELAEARQRLAGWSARTVG